MSDKVCVELTSLECEKVFTCILFVENYFDRQAGSVQSDKEKEADQIRHFYYELAQKFNPQKFRLNRRQ